MEKGKYAVNTNWKGYFLFRSRFKGKMFRVLLLFTAFVCWLPPSLGMVELSDRDLYVLKDMLKGGNGYGQKLRRQGASPWKYAVCLAVT